MSAKEPRRCVLCGALVASMGPNVLDLILSSPERRGSCVVLRWCPACFVADPLQNALAAVDAEGSDEEYAAAYLAIIDRCVAESPQQLRARIDVRRDTDMPGMTLRGSGDAWGRISRR